MTTNNHHSKARTPAATSFDIKGLWRKKLHFTIIFALGIILTHWTIAMMGEEYTAQSLLLIKPPSGDINAAPNKDKNAAFLLTELQVLQSRTLATRVVKRLNLMHDPEFNDEASGKGASLNLKIINKPETPFKDLSVNGTALKTLNPEAIDNAVSQTVTKVLNNLNIAPVAQSLAIKASFTAHNAEKSAFIVNAFVDEYLAQHMEEKSVAQKRLANILNKRLIELRKQVSDTESAVKTYRIEHDLMASEAIFSEKIAGLNTELTTAETKHREVKIKLQKLNNIARGGGDIGAIAHLVNAGLVSELSQEQSKINAELGDLSNRYGPKHPAMISKQAELKDLKSKITNALASARKTLQGEVNIAASHVKTIKKDIAASTQKASENTTAMTALYTLEHDADASRAILNTFLATYKETLGTDAATQTSAQILSYANTPQHPSFPDKKRFTIYGALLSCLAALAVALIAAKRDTRIHTIEDLERITGITNSAEIPYMRGLGKTSLTKYIRANPSSPLTESIRALFIELEQAKNNASNKTKVISFISSERDDGKTTLSALTAAAMAKSGRRVILIDANLRKPGISDALKKSAGATLVEYLSGHKALEDIIEKDKASNLDLISAQAVPNTAFDLISSKRMKSLIAGLRDQYDLIIIDTPAINEVADAKILARLSDQNVYVINWKKARYDSVQKTMQSLHDIPQSAIKIALNQMP